MKNLDARNQYKIRAMRTIAPKEGFEYTTTRSGSLCATFESTGHGLNFLGHTNDPHATPCEIIHNLGATVIDSVEINDKIVVIFDFDDNKVCKYYP